MFRHFYKRLSYGLKTTLNGTGFKNIAIQDFAGGEIFNPTGNTVATLTFYVAPSVDDTFIAAYDSAGAAVTLTVASGKAYPIPAAVFGAGALQITGDVADTIHLTFKA